MRMPRSAPIDRPLRTASLARSGPIETSTTSPPCASFSCRASSTPHSSPGSSTTSLSRESELSASRVKVDEGSGTCLTVTTIFKACQPLSLRLERGMESLDIRRGVEVFELGRVETLEPGDIQRFDHVVRRVLPRVQRAD